MSLQEAFNDRKKAKKNKKNKKSKKAKKKKIAGERINLNEDGDEA